MANTAILKFTRNQTNGLNHPNQDTEDYCEMKVTVKVNKKLYDLSYEYRYMGKANKFYNPFYTAFPTHEDEHNMRPGSDGEIIVKNKLTDCLVEYLLMPVEEMENIIGYSYAEDYKIHILQMISRLWD